MSASARPSGRIPGIEGLRAFAAAAVLVLHVWSHTAALGSFASSAWVSLLIQPLNQGVTLFFTLSGFLLWRPFAAAVLRSRSAPSLGRYARSRALRILPAYWAVLFASALVLASARLMPFGHGIDGAITDPVLLLKNALLVQNLSPSSLLSGIVPAWSLTVEVGFYACLPLLGLLALRLARGSHRRRLAAALIPAGVLLVGGVCGAIATTYLPGSPSVLANDWHSVLAWSFFSHAHLFAFGMVVAVLRVEHEDGRLALPARTRSTGDRLLVYGALPCLIVGSAVLPPTLRDPLVAAFCALLLARIVLRPPDLRPSRLVGFLDCRPLIAAGLASYSIFLWNFPITVFLVHHGLLLQAHSVWEIAINVALVAVVVGAFSALTYLAIERPAMRFGRRRRHAAPAPARLAIEAGQA